MRPPGHVSSAYCSFRTLLAENSAITPEVRACGTAPADGAHSRFAPRFGPARRRSPVRHRERLTAMDTSSVAGSLKLLACPNCHHSLSVEGDPVACSRCGACYPQRNGSSTLPREKLPQATASGHGIAGLRHDLRKRGAPQLRARHVQNWKQAFSDTDEGSLHGSIPRCAGRPRPRRGVRHWAVDPGHREALRCRSHNRLDLSFAMLRASSALPASPS